MADIAKLAELIKDKAVLFGDFTLRSGKKSSYYIDKYLFETDPFILASIADCVAELIPEETTVLAGVELGAVPLATAVSLKTGIPFIIVRKETKEYGTTKAFEGKVSDTDKVLIVEDVVTTGGAAIKAIGNLRKEDVDIIGLIGIIDREEGGVANIEAEGIPVRTVLNKTALGLQ